MVGSCGRPRRYVPQGEGARARKIAPSTRSMAAGTTPGWSRCPSSRYRTSRLLPCFPGRKDGCPSGRRGQPRATSSPPGVLRVSCFVSSLLQACLHLDPEPSQPDFNQHHCSLFLPSPDHPPQPSAAHAPLPAQLLPDQRWMSRKGITGPRHAQWTSRLSLYERRNDERARARTAHKAGRAKRHISAPGSG